MTLTDETLGRTTKERPILFSAPMVRAILSGRKTQTRRLLGLDTFGGSATPGYDWTWRGQAPIRSIAQQRRYPNGCWQDVREADLLALCPYGEAGDRLWVRETWSTATGNGHRTVYRADLGTDRWPPSVDVPREDAKVWKPSIHMKRSASRLTLLVESVRVERLHAITEADAKAEGIDRVVVEGRDLGWRNYLWHGDREAKRAAVDAWPHQYSTYSSGLTPARGSFSSLWASINGAESWDANPWTWVITFSRVQP